MKKKDIFKIITNQYIKNIADLTEEYTNVIHLLYREGDFVDDEVVGIFGEIGEASGRYSSYLLDKDNHMFNEEDIYKVAKKAKEDFDTFK